MISAAVFQGSIVWCSIVGTHVMLGVGRSWNEPDREKEKRGLLGYVYAGLRHSPPISPQLPTKPFLWLIQPITPLCVKW